MNRLKAVRTIELIADEHIRCFEACTKLVEKFAEIPAIGVSLGVAGSAVLVFWSALRISYIEEYGELPPKDWKPEDERVERLREMMRQRN